MSLGKDLLELQETDLALMREQAALERMPEVAELARKRASHRKLKADEAKIMGLRKDAELAVEDLAAERRHAETSVAAVQEHAAAAADYQEVKRIEQELSALAKRLDKIEFSAKDAVKRAEELKAREAAVSRYIERFEHAIIEDAKVVRSKAGDMLDHIERLKGRRAELRGQLPADVVAEYDEASKEFKGLAVERLQGNKPTVCRVALQVSSMGELHRGGGVFARCPYCHRILVLDEGEPAGEE